MARIGPQYHKKKNVLQWVSLIAEINFGGVATVGILHTIAVFLEIWFIQSEEIYIKFETFQCE